ncbi:TlpA family protein disulfide reductase [Aureibaculum sp. A20]|uniref:TlpA family protein disulfide reductase n=1 Tax=Aureibaculum flavum TaxID=2795986 RepID=A0ABS0WUN7_9FLAO|nr:TlpA disulfide reductase family protein [Aureibaculum flavum]MBJ2175707.1 TlpA family protein disulfide reductase [Aureibaculum flavum]
MKKILIIIAFFSIIACKSNSKEEKYNAFVSYDETKKGTVSPTFTNYKNYKGGTTSLEDLKGKFIYVDVWATWCGPCRDEIPYLKEIEKEFRDENIAFVSISVDDLEDEQAWKAMVEENEMKGIQLFANGDTNFMNEYGIESIPRVILIDDEGKIMDYDTYLPSDPFLKESLTALLK